MQSPESSALLSAYHPSPARELDHLHRLVRELVDEELLALCSDYIETVLKDQVWRPARALSERERAYVDFTEQFASSVSTMSDEQVSRLRAFATADEIYNFVCALYIVDMTCRLNLVVPKVLS